MISKKRDFPRNINIYEDMYKILLFQNDFKITSFILKYRNVDIFEDMGRQVILKVIKRKKMLIYDMSKKRFILKIASVFSKYWLFGQNTIFLKGKSTFFLNFDIFVNMGKKRFFQNDFKRTSFFAPNVDINRDMGYKGLAWNLKMEA